ncbi:FAD binding domain-containing protein [Pseudonocardia oroxyli]|uniref:Carbon-monoxide dehydrogenase medium subunit n=1 Tax=Pseudonocardia oroxyli TaxID=366584 RepID=A0A1G8D8M8_PSEOR|nr:xanthine dehydrogenase family protein subunit M [Pseudonocardia oroxyli]SDH54086.1 carbon-monoxide dehydrogenase medium subunit [Pseudonocardia oroxyli]
MKPAPFAYEAPTTVSEAVDCLASHGEEAKVLAGGQSLVPVLALRLARYEALVDLNRVGELDYVRREGSTMVIGAMTRQATIERDPTLRAAIPVLREATRLIGHPQIRNRGTLGGSVAHGDPAAEYPAVALATDATITVIGPAGPRIIEAADLYDGPMSTTLAEDEILTAVAFPVWCPGSGFAVREMARREGDFATVGVIAGVTLADDRISRAALALFGVGATPMRFRQLEGELLGADFLAVDPTDFGETLAQRLDPPNDVHASTAYRTRVAARLVAEALDAALDTARQETTS